MTNHYTKGPFFLILLLCIVGVLIASCSHPQLYTEPKSYPLVELTSGELRTVIATLDSSKSAIKASGTLVIADEYGITHESPVILLYTAPASLYVKTYTPMTPTIFTLRAKDGLFWFHIPHRSIAYTGAFEALNTNKEYEMAVNPDHIIHAMVVQPITPNYTMTTEKLDTFYIVTIVNSQSRVLARKLWFNRIHHTVTREQYYSGQGIPSFEILRNDYAEHSSNALPFARSIHITNLRTNRTAQFTFEQVKINTPVDDTLFSFSVAEGVVVEEIR